VQSDNGSLTDRHAIRQLSSTFIRAMEGRKDMRAPLHLESMMRTAGLLEIESRMIPLPLNGWPTCKKIPKPPTPGVIKCKKSTFLVGTISIIDR
jgi:hypothetical protein